MVDVSYSQNAAPDIFWLSISQDAFDVRCQQCLDFRIFLRLKKNLH